MSVNKLGHKDKKLIIVVISAAVLLFALVAIAFALMTGKDGGAEDTPDTGETLSGTYSMSSSGGAASGSSVYIFEGRRATNRYSGASGEVVVEYDYVIAVENGVKVIKFTRLNGQGEPVGEASTHGFYTGLFNGREFISINEVFYYKQ